MWRRPVVTTLILIIVMILTLPMRAQQKPFTRDQVKGLVRDGLGDESGAKLIEQRGIDFATAEDFLQSLKAAGVSEAFLKALRAAKLPEPSNANKPLNQVQVFALLAGQASSHRVAVLVRERGIDFEPQDDYLQEVRLGGGDDELISAMKSAKMTKPATVDPAAQARQAEIRRHIARGAEFLQKERFADAEAEYRATIRLDPQNADLHVGLSFALNAQTKTDEALAEAREALGLNPRNDATHYALGEVLRGKSEWEKAIAEYREAVRLNPSNAIAHFSLGMLFARKGDLDGAIAEHREVVRLEPNNYAYRTVLGNMLEHKGDLDGAIAEYRESLRLNPKNLVAHNLLGVALEKKGHPRGALKEYRAASMLDPRTRPISRITSDYCDR